jgi:hypothetical protein
MWAVGDNRYRRSGAMALEKQDHIARRAYAILAG